MKWEESIIRNLMNNQSGQSLVELLIAMGIFVLAVTAITWLILDVFLADRTGRERTVATFLAKEGIEAAKSIRDSNWDSLSVGSHGLGTSGNSWIFQGIEEDISNHLKEGKRKIIVESVDEDRKQVTSQITWTLTEARPQNVSLVTYLTNWSVAAAAGNCDIACQWEGYTGGACLPEPACRPDINKLGGLGEYGCTANKLCCCQ